MVSLPRPRDAQAVEEVHPPAGSWRLLGGWAETGRPQTYPEHVAAFGSVPLGAYPGAAGRQRLVAEVSAAGLRGRGGAAFPTAHKLAAVASGRGRKVVIANGCEGEPSSRKDRVLAELAPHLVIDGALLAAHVTGADEVYVCVDREGPTFARLARAARDRTVRQRIQVVGVPGRFVASEESALVNYLDNQDARPTSKPPRPFERGVRGRPTFVGNVETLAQLALVARFGARWFRSVGTDGSPGTALVTVDGAVRYPGVVEVPFGITLSDVVDLGGVVEPLQAVLLGGYGGHWLSAQVAMSTPFTHEDLAAVGASVGVSSVIALPVRACGVAETAHVLRYLAGESAAQCGPCMFGLPAIASDFAALAAGAVVRDAQVIRRIERRLSTVTGRGACAHPDGAARLAASALTTFGADVRQHMAGRPCSIAGAPPRLPLWQRPGAVGLPR
jgi:NADH:ubiquinone oxidoreductase subunit F (NADH-binding)